MACRSYHIGTPGEPWGLKEKEQWRAERMIQRCYTAQVVAKLTALENRFDIAQYGSLSHNPEKYRMFYAKTREWDASKPYVLVTGGVHGYETSGVQGALLFLETKAEKFSKHYNILVLPCISPWGYETIQRWNYDAVDPNRSFSPDEEIVPGRSFNPEAVTEESSAVIALLKQLGVKHWKVHVDLHETTDTDGSEFIPAKAARDGVKDVRDDEIPDGFYLVTDQTKQNTEWFAAMIQAVEKITHIAPADEHGNIIGEKVVQKGVIAIPAPTTLGLCAGVTKNAEYAVTTEVYPDSPRATDQICNDAQVACVEAALTFLLTTTQNNVSQATC